jgi:hypothetical protein
MYASDDVFLVFYSRMHTFACTHKQTWNIITFADKRRVLIGLHGIQHIQIQIKVVDLSNAADRANADMTTADLERQKLAGNKTNR